MEMKRMSEYERTGKLQPKIDVHVSLDGGMSWSYSHSTCWHRTCRDAVEAARLVYGAHKRYRATFDRDSR